MILVTSHGQVELDLAPNERIIDCLIRFQIPWAALSFYLRTPDSDEYKVFIGLEKKLSDLPNNAKLFAFYQRNIDPFLHRIGAIDVIKADEGAVTEFLYRAAEQRDSEKCLLKQLTPDECCSAVQESVHSMLRQYVEPNSSIIVGISGGGDSNALLYAMTTFRDFKLSIHPIILQGLPEWDAGTERAKALCDTYNLDLKIVDEISVRKAIGASETGAPFVDRFYKNFSDDDFEFVGTLLIGIVLRNEAKALGATYICKGANLEDLLAEALCLVANKKQLRPLPKISFDGVHLIYPLWQMPKKIIDGCFPKYSFTNYQERFPSFCEGRALFYQMAYQIVSYYPSIGEKMLLGFSAIGNAGGWSPIFDKNLGFHIF